jgi:uncharacterized protein
MVQLTDTLLHEMTESIIREVNPRKVVLFGSHAKGTARPDSDIDFLIVEDGPFNAQRSRRAEMARLWKLLRSYPLPKDFLVFTPEEVEQWGQVRNHVLSHALQEGKVLYERP